jgi:septal ring-binding cell division protein DamX
MPVPREELLAVAPASISSGGLEVVGMGGSELETDEVISVETDSVETGVVEMDVDQTDVVETDVVEVDVIETDDVETDIAEIDVIEADDVETDVVEVEVDPTDVVDTDYVETEIMEMDVDPTDNVETDVLETDAAQPEVVELAVGDADVVELEADETIVAEPELEEAEVLGSQVAMLEVDDPGVAVADDARIEVAMSDDVVSVADSTVAIRMEPYALPDDAFVVQLVAMRSARTLDRLINDRGLTNVFPVRIAVDGEVYHVLVTGPYDDEPSAQEFAAVPPDQLQDFQPWVRSVRSLKAAMRAADELTASDADEQS